VSTVGLVLAVVAFVAMEPVTYAVHRWVMHGPGQALHRSHHRPPVGRFERNDLYPVSFAAVVGAGMAVGFNVDGWGGLVPVGIGVTAYGAVYAAVHDGHLHGRVRWVARRPGRGLVRLAEAHRIHHLFGGEPYGMLLPIVPASLRARAAATGRDPLVPRLRSAQRAPRTRGQPASGSRPSHVPVLP
jgi:beta-carotene 3-hydroxylase